jgi:ABC-type transport system involved in cytochrome bd biosynthesis fused ATPase/permease subunit
VLQKQEPKQAISLREMIGDLNLLQILLVIYAIPVIALCALIGAGFIALALSDPGFAQLLLFTLIIGMIFGLPEALK